MNIHKVETKQIPNILHTASPTFNNVHKHSAMTRTGILRLI